LEGNLLSSNVSYTSLQYKANFGPLTAEVGWRVWGTPANFNVFCVLASLLQQRCTPEANQTLHDVATLYKKLSTVILGYAFPK